MFCDLPASFSLCRFDSSELRGFLYTAFAALVVCNLFFLLNAHLDIVHDFNKRASKEDFSQLSHSQGVPSGSN